MSNKKKFRVFLSRSGFFHTHLLSNKAYCLVVPIHNIGVLVSVTKLSATLRNQENYLSMFSEILCVLDHIFAKRVVQFTICMRGVLFHPNNLLPLNILLFSHLVSSQVHNKGESPENPTKNTKLSDLAASAAEIENLPVKLDKLEIDPKISENNQER